jgi:hypothetical protein
MCESCEYHAPSDTALGQKVERYGHSALICCLRDFVASVLYRVILYSVPVIGCFLYGSIQSLCRHVSKKLLIRHACPSF